MSYIRSAKWFVITKNIIIWVLRQRKFGGWKERISLASPVKLLHDCGGGCRQKAEAVTLLDEQGRCKNVKYSGFDMNTL